jgi:hypothetical protein
MHNDMIVWFARRPKEDFIAGDPHSRLAVKALDDSIGEKLKVHVDLAAGWTQENLVARPFVIRRPEETRIECHGGRLWIGLGVSCGPWALAGFSRW